MDWPRRMRMRISVEEIGTVALHRLAHVSGLAALPRKEQRSELVAVHHLNLLC